MKNLGEIRNMIHRLGEFKKREIVKNTDNGKRSDWHAFDRADSAQQALEWVVNDSRTKSPLEYNK